MSKKSYSVYSQHKIKNFNKTIEVDSDKSISIRSFIIGSISQGITEVSNVLESQDVFSTINCLRKLNVKIKKIGIRKYKVFGKGLGSFYAKKNTLIDFQNSGTCSRLLQSIIAVTPGLQVRLTGDASLRKRNMSKLINILNQFGAEFLPKNKANLPYTVCGSDMPIGILYKAGVSSQLKSAAILSATNAHGTSTVIENRRFESRDHTENLLLKNSNVIKIKKNNRHSIIKIFGKKYLNSLKYKVFGDPSSAAFFAAICILNSKSKLKIKNIGLNPKRVGFFKLIKSCGAKIKFKNIKKNNINELVGDLYVESGSIRPIRAKPNIYPTMPDEYPILFIIAALTPGKHVFLGISDLSNKESSRAFEMKKILVQIGIKCKLTKNKMIIFGKKNIKYNNLSINIRKNILDHRLYMSALCLSLVTGIKCNLKGFQTVETSAPSFLKIIKNNLNGKFKIKKN